MAGINHLKEVYEKRGEDFLSNLLNNYVIINEKVDGTFFGVKKTKNDNFRYFKKSGEITYVDRVLMKYYNSAISYFESMSDEKRQRIPSNFYFGFEYLTRGDITKYSSLPKNNLILSYIHKLDDSGNIVSTVQNKEQLDQWADYLGVERPPIIFEGKLTDEQKTAILEFVYSDSSELSDKFKTKSFTKYIISILNDEYENSFLNNTADTDTIVFRFYDESNTISSDKSFLAKLVDPIFQNRVSANPSKENKSQDYIWLIVIDIMNFFEMYNLDDLTNMVKGETFDEKYVNLINSIFKDFIKEYSGKYEGLIIDIPDYLKRDEFKLDLDLINDPEIVKILKKDEIYTEIYKILLNFFRRTRKKSSSGFFTPDLVTQLNLIVTKIKNVIMGDNVYESLFPSFSEFIGSQHEEWVLSEREVAEKRQVKEDTSDVNLLIGNFQPVTLGHIKAAQKLKDKNGNHVIFVAIKSESLNKKSPFSLKETKSLLEKVKAEYPDLIKEVVIVSSGQVEEIIKSIPTKYSPILWGTSDRRIKDYALQLDYIKKKNIPLRLSSNYKLVELPTFIKSETVIKTITDSDFIGFKKLVPMSISSEFFNLQKELAEVNEEKEEILPEVTQIFEREEVSIEVIDPKLKEEDSSDEEVI